VSAWLAIAILPHAAAANTTTVEVPTPLPLSWCLERARQANPSLELAASAESAAQSRIASAGAFEDPRVSYELSNIPTGDFDLSSTPLSGQQLGLKQKLPFPGVLGNRESAARSAADAAQWLTENRQFRVAALVEQAWANFGFAQRALAITDRNIEFLRQLTRIAETKYSVGTGLQQDVLRAQVELTSLLSERLTRVSTVARSESELAALLDLPPEVKLPETEPLKQEAPLPLLGDLLSRIEGQSPLLKQLSGRIDEAEHLQRAAQFEGYPDFDLGIGYRIRRNVSGDSVDGDDFVSAGVTIRLPVNRRKWRARIAERESMARGARAEYRDMRARIVSVLRSRFASLERADAEVDLIGAGLIPQARQSLASTRSGYEVDKVDFLSLIDSQVRLLDAELRLERAWADRRAAFAAVEAELGEKLR
jgi:outer membrane protein TolC